MQVESTIVRDNEDGTYTVRVGYLGETIIFRSSSAKKGFDTFTLPKAYEGKNVDIFFK